MEERLVPKEQYMIDWACLSAAAQQVCSCTEQRMYSVRTRGDGACGVHAVFGEPSEEGEFVKQHAPEFAAAVLSSGMASLLNSEQSE
eukprot:9865868-Karenia_brevis.AAC.1